MRLSKTAQVPLDEAAMVTAIRAYNTAALERHPDLHRDGDRNPAGTHRWNAGMRGWEQVPAHDLCPVAVTP